MVLLGVQSEHARQQWQKLDHENKQLMNAYQQEKVNNQDIMNKVSSLIEQGIITQEQFDKCFIKFKGTIITSQKASYSYT